MRAASDATHVFYCTWSRQPNEDENVRVNARMIRNFFAGIAGAPIRHAALVTGLKHYLGSFDEYGKVKPYTPFLESSPRLPGPNFYYAQEDVLFEVAGKRGFSWSVHRPHTMIGFVIGNLMNMAVTLAVYASICKHTGRPFVYPGSPEQYNAVTDVTDARILAKHLHWAATTPAAANTPFNIVNGDVFRWTWLWRQIADYFEHQGRRIPGPPQPARGANERCGRHLAEIVAKHGLEDIPVDQACVLVAQRCRPRADAGMFHRHDQQPGARLLGVSADDAELFRRVRRTSGAADHPRLSPHRQEQNHALPDPLPRNQA